MVHIGLISELMQDARANAISDADIEPWYRGAEAYVRMWERSAERAAALAANICLLRDVCRRGYPVRVVLVGSSSR